MCNMEFIFSYTCASKIRVLAPVRWKRETPWSIGLVAFKSSQICRESWYWFCSCTTQYHNLSK